MSQDFHVFVPTDPEGVRRLATPEEQRFLKRYNLVRLWRMLLFWLLPLFLVGVIVALHALVFIWARSAASMGSAAAPLLVLVPLLFMDWVYLKQWGGPLMQALRMRPFLRVPSDLQVMEFEAPLRVLVHRTDHEVNIFTAGTTLIDLPEHWEDEVLRQVKASAEPGTSRFALVSLPGARNQMIRLPMNRINLPSLRDDILLRDIGHVVVGLDKLSIQQEMRAGLPILRGHPGMLVIGGLFALAAALSALIWRETIVDTAARQEQKLERNAAQLTSRYLGGERVDMAALRARGFEGLAYMPDTQEKVVAGAPFERRVAAQSRQGPPFLLSEAEWNAVQRASFVFPKDLPGSAPIQPERIEAYRRMLLDRLAGNDVQRARVRALIQDLPQAIVEGQLRALAMGNRPDPAFIGALLPGPLVHPGEEGAAYPAGILCKEGVALCQAGLNAVVSWTEPGFISGAQGSVGVVDASDVARISAMNTELAALQQERRGEIAKAVIAILATIALLCFFLYWHARRRLKRYWREGVVWS